MNLFLAAEICYVNDHSLKNACTLIRSSDQLGKNKSLPKNHRHEGHGGHGYGGHGHGGHGGHGHWTWST